MDARSSGADDDESAESLYDRYLDAALEGRADDPETFLASHPSADATLRARIEALHRVVRDEDPGCEAHPAIPAADGLPFERLGEFRLLRRLDEGGMGTVYLAEQTSLGRLVAVKVLRPELKGSPTAGARLEREALAVAKLDHPHVADVYAVGEDHGVRYLAMQFVPGRGLDEVLAEAVREARPIPTPRVLRWGVQLARALACAHAARIVHRDVKPSNVRITPDDRAVLLDFGIARDLSRQGLTLSATVAGPLVGSPVYAAPEQFGERAGAIDERTDVYGLGATLYECLGGREPFRADTFERLIHRMLHEEPAPLRRLAPAVPREVETIVRKAMEKDPARRYASANALADDLEAMLELRPISARPPGVGLRTWKWARRHPAPATAIATAILAAFVLFAVLVARERADAQRVRDEARDSLRRAGAQIDLYRTARAASQELELEVGRLRERLGTEFLTDDELAHLDAEEERVNVLRRTREETFYEVLDLLRRAEQLDPTVDGVAATRARLYLERWHESRTARDKAAEGFYRDLVLGLDGGGEAGRELTGAGHVTFVSNVPDVELYLHRYRELSTLDPSAPPRQVPVPVQQGAPAVAPGTACLLVEASSGALAPGDLVLTLDGAGVGDVDQDDTHALLERGGADARVFTGGAVTSTRLQPGLRAHRTVAPPVLDARCRIGAGERASLEPGSYLLVARGPGREASRVWLTLQRGDDITFGVDPPLEGATPEGFVRIVPQIGSDLTDFFVQLREVTVAEYAEFLDDPGTRTEIAASPSPIRFPRDPSNARDGGYWTRSADGALLPPAPEELDCPIYGVSRDDAAAYAAWWGRRRQLSERRLVADIPTHAEWLLACGSMPERPFVFGARFRPRFASSCYARPKPRIEPVLSYPIDESPAGVCDLSGSVMEWVSGDYVGTLGRLCGGSWARADPDDFEIFASRALRADVGYGESGFRIVIRPAEERR